MAVSIAPFQKRLAYLREDAGLEDVQTVLHRTVDPVSPTNLTHSSLLHFLYICPLLSLPALIFPLLSSVIWVSSDNTLSAITVCESDTIFFQNRWMLKPGSL